MGKNLFAILMLGITIACSHPIVITPDVSQVSREGITPIEKNIGYYISNDDKAKLVTSPGGGGDKVAYYPYKELEPAIFKALSNLFRRAYPLKSANDLETIKSNDISFVFIPEIATDSSSSGVLTWPPTGFTVTIRCKAFDKTGTLLWEKSVTGQGAATFDEFKTEFSLAAKRASLKAVAAFQAEINNAQEFHK
jgi:hypothetical protein